MFTIFLKNKKVQLIFLFIIVFSYFLWFNSTPFFSDPDSFYHAKMIELIKDSGIVKDFNWLPFTSLNEIYIDHHLLYHLILVPFVFLFNSLLVVKIGAVFFADLAVVIFYWLLKKFNIKYAWLYLLILLFTHQFIFRINLAKVPSLSLIFLLIFLYFLFKHSPPLQANDNGWSWPLFIISFLYVWLYGGWPIMLGIGIIFYLTDAIYQWARKISERKFRNWGIRKLKLISQYPNVLISKLLLSVILGIIAGLIINPYFPTNLKFYWQQTFQIGLINYKNIISVGGEWYAFGLHKLIAYDALVFIILLIALYVFVTNIRKQDHKNWALLITTIIFFILTIKSRRNIEYLIPFSLIFSAFVINPTLISSPLPRGEGLGVRGLFKSLCNQLKLKQFINYKPIISATLISLLILQIPALIGFNYFGLKSALQTGYRLDQFKHASRWLENNTNPGEIIFHDNWSDWPSLFYYNHYNKYIIGLDPSFMYFKDKNKYWTWHTISHGEVKNNVCQIVKQEFGANYIFVNKENDTLLKNINSDRNCTLVYQDQDGKIYKIEIRNW